MVIESLSIDGLRCLKGLDLSLGPGLHVFIGANGSGKTSILEAISLLGSGKSFRAGGSELLISRGKAVLNVFAEIRRGEALVRLGFSREAKSWRAKRDGVELRQLSEMVRELPVWVVEPNSHELMFGGSSARRSLFDWLMFHVEPSFAQAAARYNHALRLRNAALKNEASNADLSAWDQIWLSSALAVRVLRDRYVAAWCKEVNRFAQSLLPELGKSVVEFKSGFPVDMEPDIAILERRARDLGTGYTSIGPHRADWSLRFEHAPEREHYSRGQSKNACFAAVLATLAVYQHYTGLRPVLCLDDLFSELDIEHQRLCLRYASSVADQVLVTGVLRSEAIDAWPGTCSEWQMSDLFQSQSER